ncbi:hypothetical protein A1O1_06993 [Capronia coronata CBS 617.96]|uniref:DUF7908 domain-containing protein n=1 Tax=Capronia coronata CBS 617.96 TaxID=1182541 RepID=W9Y2D4_9EURO|nr:uncharacterized protein A1O1_06993 [Capronia coronata CBS 617.96]EXJ83371.1 hypothetical protein A1O1_06993 [Capronia coronata CBS 617.96]
MDRPVLLLLWLSLSYVSWAQPSLSIVTSVVYVTSTICPVPPSCLRSTSSVSSTSLPPSTTTNSPIETTTSTTSGAVASPTDDPFTIRVLTQDGGLQKRTYHYVAFDDSVAVTVDDLQDAALFYLTNGYLISDGMFIGVTNATGFQLLQKYGQPVNVSQGWTMGPDRGVSFHGALFTTEDGTADFCALPDGTLVMEITDSPDIYSDAELAALPNAVYDERRKFGSVGLDDQPGYWNNGNNDNDR